MGPYCNLSTCVAKTIIVVLRPPLNSLSFVTLSVTKWFRLFYNFWPLVAIIICPIELNIAERGSHFLPNTKYFQK